MQVVTERLSQKKKERFPHLCLTLEMRRATLTVSSRFALTFAFFAPILSQFIVQMLCCLILNSLHASGRQEQFSPAFVDVGESHIIIISSVTRSWSSTTNLSVFTLTKVSTRKVGALQYKKLSGYACQEILLNRKELKQKVQSRLDILSFIVQLL